MAGPGHPGQAAIGSPEDQSQRAASAEIVRLRQLHPNMSFRQIAACVGYHPETARRIYYREVGQYTTDEVRKRLVSLYEEMIDAIRPFVLGEGQPLTSEPPTKDPFMAMLKVLREMRAMLGLDEPKRTEATVTVEDGDGSVADDLLAKTQHIMRVVDELDGVDLSKPPPKPALQQFEIDILRQTALEMVPVIDAEVVDERSEVDIERRALPAPPNPHRRRSVFDRTGPSPFDG
jgi:hypothetical protein